MDELIIKILGGIVLFFLTFWQFNTRQLAQKAKDDLAEYKTHVAENYVHEKIFNRRFDDIDAKLDKIFTLVEKKADK